MPSSHMHDLYLKVKEKLKKNQISVSVETYDVIQGVTHGTLQALACGALNPIDKKNAAEVTRKRLMISAQPETCAPKKPFTVRSAFQNFKATFPEHPWAGTGYGIKTNIPRNAATFTFVPMVNDELQGRSLTSMQCDVVAGLGGSMPEAIATARLRAIRVQHQLYTSTLSAKVKPLAPRHYWNTIPAEVRSANVKSALVWGIAKNGAYWAVFPALTTLLESQLTRAIKHFELESFQSFVMLDYAMAGAIAGGIAPVVSYPLDVMEKRAIFDPNESQFKRTWNYYCQHGMWKTIQNETHVSYFKTVLPRMMISSALYNLTLHAAKASCDVALEKEDRHESLPTPGLKK